MRSLAKILAGLAGLFLLLMAGAFWYLSTLDISEYRGEIAKMVEDFTGRQLRVERKLSLDVFPSPKLIAEGIALSNAEWGTRPDLVTVERLEAEVSLGQLLAGTVAVDRILLLRPDIFLETDPKGRVNWSLAASSTKDEKKSEQPGLVGLDVSNVDIRDARISFRDGAENTTRVIELKEVLLKRTGWRQPLAVEMRGRIDERDVELTGETGTLVTFLANDPYSFDLNFRVLDSELEAVGSIKQPMDMRGINADVVLKAPRLSDLLALAGVSSRLSLPIEGKAAFRDDESRYLVDGLQLTLGKSDVSGNLSYSTANGRAVVNAALQSRVLDLDEISTGEAKQKADRVIPAEPLPLNALRSADADIAYRGIRVISGGMELNAFSVDLKLRDGRLEITPKSGLYGGELAGVIGLDAAADRPRFHMDLKAKQVNLGALLNAVKKSDVMSGGTTEISLKLSGRGKTMRDIAASSNGLLLAKIGPGKIHNSAVETAGADAVMQLVRAASGDEQSDYTDFDCGVVRFDVKKGQAVTKKGIAVENDRMNVIGSGTVDLGTEALDIAVKTEPKEGVGLSTGAIGLGVHVGGTLAHPDTSLDSLGTLKAGASVGAAVATGGLSLLAQALFSRATADDTPCATALGIKKKTAKKTAKKTESAARPSSRNAEEDNEPSSSGAADALKGLGESLKGLFGN